MTRHRTTGSKWFQGHLPLAIAAALLLAACGGPGDGEAEGDGGVETAPPTDAAEGATEATEESVEQTSLTVAMPGFGELTSSPVFVADVLGFYEDENLEVELLPAGGGADAAAVLLSGEAELGSFTASHSYTVAAEGGRSPLLAPLAVGFQGLSFMMSAEALEARGIDPDSSLEERLSNLEGLTVGISSPGSTTDNLARAVAEQAGLNPDTDWNIVPAGSVGDATTAMTDGSVEAAVSVLPISATAEAAGAAIVFDFGSDFEQFSNVIFAAVMANDAWLQENPDVAERYLRAIARAMDAINEDPEGAYDAAYEPYFAEGVPDRSLYDASWPRVPFPDAASFDLSDEVIIATYENYVQPILEIEIPDFSVDKVADQGPIQAATASLQ